MEITIIHGQNHKGNTYHITTMLKEKLMEEDTIIHEFYLPKDGPAYCLGCCKCILEGEENCYQYEKLQEILTSMLQSRIIIVDSPNYCFEMTGQLKTLFDHFAYIWMPHRPRKEMFTKIGIAISTAAGGGAGSVTKSISRQLFWWGIPKIYKLNFIVNASCWNEISQKKKDKIIRRTDSVSKKIKRRIGKIQTNFKTKLLFSFIRKMQKSNNWNQIEKNYWQMNNWLEKSRPWRKK